MTLTLIKIVLNCFFDILILFYSSDIEQQQKTVVRRCQLADVDCCNYTDQQIATAQYPRGLVIEACEICQDKDGCNGSSDTEVFGVLMTVAIAVTMSRYIIL